MAHESDATNESELGRNVSSRDKEDEEENKNMKLLLLDYDQLRQDVDQLITRRRRTRTRTRTNSVEQCKRQATTKPKRMFKILSVIMKSGHSKLPRRQVSRHGKILNMITCPQTSLCKFIFASLLIISIVAICLCSTSHTGDTKIKINANASTTSIAQRHRPSPVDVPLVESVGNLDESALQSEKEARLFQVAAELMSAGRPAEVEPREQRASADSTPPPPPPPLVDNQLETATAKSVIELTSMTSARNASAATDYVQTEGSDLKSVVTSRESEQVETTTTTTTTTSTTTARPRVAQLRMTTEPPEDESSDTIPEFLRDDLHHETDKLSHLTANIQRQAAARAKTRAESIAEHDNERRRPGTVKYDSQGWRPTARDSSPRLVAANMKDVLSKDVTLNYHDQLPALSEPLNGFYGQKLATRDNFSTSQLQPKHVSPPETLKTNHRHHQPIAAAAAAQAGQLIGWRPQLSPLVANLSSAQQTDDLTSVKHSPFRFAKSGRHLVALQKLRPTNLLPRLAAKLLSPLQASVGGGGDTSEPLNQQQSHLFATHHNSPANFLAPQKSFAKRLPSVKLLAASKQPSQTIANTKLTSGERGHPLYSAPVRLPLFAGTQAQQSADSANTQTGEQQRPRANLILMNGQVYSVTNFDNDLMPQPQQQQQQQRQHERAPPASVFDHATSDTSDFPIFEAISQAGQHPAASSTWSPIQQDQLGTGPFQAASSVSGTPARCDRPRHIIQADRTVVNHILASEQNFVIARVPIKKFPRAQQQVSSLGWAASNAASFSNNYQHPTGFQGQFQQQQQQFMGLPSLQQTTSAIGGGGQQPQPSFLVSGSSPGGGSGQFQSMAPTTTIEVTSGTRPGLLHSIVQLIGNLRRRPVAATFQAPASGFASASGPLAQFALPSFESMNLATGSASQPTAILTVDGPVLLASARDDKTTASHHSLSSDRLIKLKHLLAKLKSAKPTPRRSLQGRGQAGAIADHSAYAASIISSQFSTGPQLDPLFGSSNIQMPSLASAASSLPQHPHHLQLDPMRRLLMLKTSSENEVCSPIGEIGAKIKYSCVPNSCVVSALANAARGLGLQQQQQQQSGSGYNQQVYSDTSQLYKMSHSMEPQPRVQVTYTHLNAYQTPPGRRVVQPQHQQFVSSSQVLDSLAENDQLGGGQGEYQPQDYQQPTRSPLPEITFGTAYVRQSTASPLRATYVQRTSVRPNGGYHTTTTSSEDYENDEPAGPASSSDGPNEFSTIVDEQLEQPIRVSTPTRGRSKVQKQQKSRRREQQQQRLEQREQVAPPIENGGSSAENAPVENAMSHHNQANNQQRFLDYAQQQPYHVSENRKQRRLAPWPPQSQLLPPPTPPAQLGGYVNSPSTSAHASDDDQPPSGEDAEDDEDGEEEQANEQQQQQQQPQPQQMNNNQSANAAIAPIDMTRPIAIGTSQEALARQTANSKFRRDKPAAATTTPAGAYRYGQRQLTTPPLPAPEKAAAIDYGQQQTSDRYGSGFTSTPRPGTSTECDCTNNATAAVVSPSSAVADAERESSTELEPRERLTGGHRQRPVPQTTSGQPSPVTSTIGGGGWSAAAQAGDGGKSASVVSSFLPKDRRQTGISNNNNSSRPLSYGPGPLDRNYLTSSTKRPYNLRNTTYKNLLLTNTNELRAVQLSPPPPDRHEMPASDLTTTTAGGPVEFSPLLSSTLGPPSSSAFSGNNLTHFDDLANEQPATVMPNQSYVTGNQIDELLRPADQLHVAGHQHRGDHLPATSSMGQSVESGVPTPPPRRLVKIATKRAKASLSSLRTINGTAGGHHAHAVMITPERMGANESDIDAGQFKPSSVNDIVAQARREQLGQFSLPLSLLENSTHSEQPVGTRSSSPIDAAASADTPAPSERRLPKRRGKKLDKKEENDGRFGQDEDDEPEQDVTPHQYQIQLRWNGKEAEQREQATPPPPQSPPNLPASGSVDKLGERVRDRLFEHREEEHWHERDWLRANHLASPTDSSKPAPLADPHQLDYGPHERETPVRDQLPNAPSEKEVSLHFAIPTRNFRQSREFVEWAQRDVNLNEWPSEPTTTTTKSSGVDGAQQNQTIGLDRAVR